jgi:bacteriocin-like protein
MQELNDTDLANIVGGSISVPTIPSGNGSTAVGISANASASGDKSATTFTGVHGMTAPVGNGGSLSLAFGFAGAVAS